MVNYSSAEKKIIDFARNYPAITGLSLGCCPEESKYRVYYFLIDGEILDRDRSDAISRLEIDLTQRKKPSENFALAEWPADAFNRTFLGEVIWRR
ncbi:hypothetical protein J4423_00765 [Candidatus Pacearchaeota archaeon]|nr:hypothetical protein [Candidatus Pacearchaeota archaeon]